jgi:hypothetical protein
MIQCEYWFRSHYNQKNFQNFPIFHLKKLLKSKNGEKNLKSKNLPISWIELLSLSEIVVQASWLNNKSISDAFSW